jgi:hypothetical protein
VLVAGGYNYGTNITYSSAELYDPSSGAWSYTGSLTGPRSNHMATRLHTGKVLVVGGYYGVEVLTSAELYDPAFGTWAATGRGGRCATPCLSHKPLVDHPGTRSL